MFTGERLNALNDRFKLSSQGQRIGNPDGFTGWKLEALLAPLDGEPGWPVALQEGARSSNDNAPEKKRPVTTRLLKPSLKLDTEKRSHGATREKYPQEVQEVGRVEPEGGRREQDHRGIERELNERPVASVLGPGEGMCFVSDDEFITLRRVNSSQREGGVALNSDALEEALCIQPTRPHRDQAGRGEDKAALPLGDQRHGDMGFTEADFIGEESPAPGRESRLNGAEPSLLEDREPIWSVELSRVDPEFVSEQAREPLKLLGVGHDGVH